VVSIFSGTSTFGGLIANIQEENDTLRVLQPVVSHTFNNRHTPVYKLSHNYMMMCSVMIDISEWQQSLKSRFDLSVDIYITLYEVRNSTVTY
jgi:hypothetical protein